MVTYEEIVAHPAGSNERRQLLFKWNEECCLRSHLKDIENIDFPSYNHVGDKIDTTYNSRYKTYDTLDLYKGHEKIVKLIDGCKGNDRRFTSPTGYDVNKIAKVRDITQMFLDDIIFRTGFDKKLNFIQIFFLKLFGQYEKRKRMFIAYMVIYNDLAQRLDHADGGLEQNEEEQKQMPHTKIGF